MLGRLARWLRLFGYAVDYSNRYTDEMLINKAIQQKMVLITADESLYQQAIRRKIESLLIKEGTIEEKIALTVEKYDLKVPHTPEFRRCPRCGYALRREEKENLSGKVPPHSYERYDEYWVCANTECGKIYWRGSHWGNIQKTLSIVEGIIKKRGR
jgi:uncharacterized protein with PIN domain